MAARAFYSLLTASFVFSIAVLTAAVGNAQIPTRTPDWVNVKDPQFGARGDGSHDDTAAIQAAIDYASSHHRNAVYCPAGTYKVSNTIWLDPPNNMRSQTWAGTGHFTASGNVFTVDTTTSGSLAVGDYLYGTGLPTSGPTIITGGAGTSWTVNNSFTLGTASLAASNPANVPQFSFQLSFFGDPSNEAYFPGCRLNFTFNNAPAFMVGTGQGMHVADIAVVGPGIGGNGGYRCGQSPYGVGIGINGGGGGSHINLIEDTFVSNFYSLWKTSTNGGSLGDSNSWRNPNGSNGCIGINLSGTQSYINDIVEPTISSTTTGITDWWSHQLNVFGGNISATSARNSAALNMGNVTYNSGSGSGSVNINATLPTSDTNVGTIYNSYTAVTPHFGLVPMTLTSWNAATGAAVFAIWPPWFTANYGRILGNLGTRFYADLTNATVYGAERVEVAQGTGIVLEGLHVENPSACTTFVDFVSVWGDQVSNEIRDPYFDYDTSQVINPNTAEMYCQQSFPFIYAGYYGENLKWHGGRYTSYNPLIMDFDAFNDIDASQLGSLNTLNLRVYDGALQSHGQLPQVVGIGPAYYSGQLATVARGGGKWDTTYFRPWAAYGTNPNTTGFDFSSLLTRTEASSPFCGYEPCPWTTPNLSTTLYGMVAGGASLTGTIDNGTGTGSPAGKVLTVTAVGSGILGPSNIISGSGVTAGTAILNQLSGTTGGVGTYQVNDAQAVAAEALTASLGALGSYFPVACRTVFKSVDWNTGAVTPPGTPGGGIFKRSASCPGYSWGQNLTQATLGSTDNADGTGYIDNGSGSAGTTLHWTATSGTLNDGDTITGAGISTATYVVAQLAGTTGGTGTYQLSVSQLAGSSGAPVTLAAPSAAWAYMGGTDVLYLDASTLKWVFPGLGIAIDNGSGAQSYIVTGVYPFLGYATVIWAGSVAGGQLQGGVGALYSCSSNCTIGQAPFAWTAY